MNFRERVEVEKRKTMIPSPIPAILWIVGVWQGKYQQKEKKKRRKKEKNTGKTQTKLNAPHVRSCKNTISIINNWR